ncbi:MAG: hypothetical protein R3194_12300, partial [Limnobacter sp.]|nr:hypothetical protein [Limnobacter sp.]
LLLVSNQLNQWQFEDDVQHIELRCTQLDKNQPKNLTLLPDEQAQSADSWQQVCDQLRARLGDQAIQFPVLHSDPRPECAFTLASETPVNPQQKRPTTRLHELSPEHLRPLWLLDKPTEVKHVADWTLLSGPERIEFGWWDAQACKRDYYLATNTQNQQVWLFKDLTESNPHRAWYLHGYFA